MVDRMWAATAVEAAPMSIAASVEEYRLDFPGDANALRVLVECERLSDGHLFDPAFAIEIGEIDPPPHQRIAVYQRTLLQHRLRLLLANDAGVGKTIMTGLASTSARACRAGGSAASWWATGTANCTSCSSCSSGS